MTIDTKKAFELKSSDFIEVSESTNLESRQNFSVVWTAAPSLPYFRGHFPENPILPAVAIIDATVSFLRQRIANPMIEISELVNCKFTGVIVPSEKLVIKYSLKRCGDVSLECQSTWHPAETLEQKVVSLHIKLKES